MEVFSLLRRIAIILPTLLTVVIPGLYKIYAEDASDYSKGEECTRNKLHFSISANPLLEIFLYLRHIRSTSFAEPNNSGPHLHNSASVLPSIWSVISPFEYEEEEWKEADAGQSALTRTVCKDQGPFAFYFPQKETWSCQLVRGAEEFSKEYFWELLLPFVCLVSAVFVYILVRQESFRYKWDNMLEFILETLSFYPKYSKAKGKLISSKIEEVVIESDSEDEIGAGDERSEKIPCQCEMCSVHLAAQILLKQKVEELESTFF